MSKYIDAEKLIAEIERRKNESRELAQEHKNSSLGNAAQTMANEDEEILSLITSLQQEQPEVNYNIIPLPEERMVSYIAYCLRREDDDCNCPTCGKHVTGLRHFPYYYDRENNDVYFASVCPECGKIIISKE